MEQAVASFGGNTTLYDNAQAHHNELYDKFFDNDGKIDCRAVVGDGVPTVVAANIYRTGEANLTIGPGDGTVPLKSAIQGTYNQPDAHIQTVCRGEHQDLPGLPSVINAYKDFLLTGRTPRKLDPPGSCATQGGPLVIYGLGDANQPKQSAGHASRVLSGAGTALTLQQAARQGRVEVMTLPTETLVVLNAATPTPLTFNGKNLTFSYSPYDNGHHLRTRYYGPVTGKIVIGRARTAGQPSVKANGRVVRPASRAPILCVVPKLKGQSMARATRLLKRAHCGLGRLTQPKQAGNGKLIISRQAIPAGTRERRGVAVGITLAYKR